MFTGFFYLGQVQKLHKNPKFISVIRSVFYLTKKMHKFLINMLIINLHVRHTS